MNFNGSSLSFSAADQIALIQAQGGILADIVSAIDNTGLSYTYSVILANTAGDAFVFGHDVPGTFTAFPTSVGGEFSLPGTAGNAGTLTGGHMLTGSVTFGGGGGGGGGTPAPTECDAGSTLDVATDTCIADTELAQESLDNATDTIDMLDENATPDEVEDAIDGLADAADEVIDAGDPDQAVAVLNTINIAVDTLSGPALEDEDLLTNIDTLLGTTALVLGSLDGDDLTDDQLDDANTATADLLITVTNTLDNVDTDTETDSTVEQVEDVVNASIELNQGNLNEEITEQVVEIVDSTDTEIDLDPIDSGDDNDYDNYNDVSVNGLTPSGVLDVAGLGPSGGSPPSALGETLSGQARAELQNFWLLAPGSLNLDSDQSALSLGEDESLMHVVSMQIVPSDTLQGGFFGPNGNLFAVAGNVLIELSPAAADLSSFIDGVEGIGATIELLEKGGVSISDGTVTAYATFGFESLQNIGDPNPSDPTFAGPDSGDESDADYVFTVNYANGISQDLQPLIADDAFFDSVIAFGYFIGQDRATGIISIDGIGNFRPSYVVSPIEFSDAVFFQLNQDASGVAYKVLDVNNDGVLDVQVLTSSLSQVVFGMP